MRCLFCGVKVISSNSMLGEPVTLPGRGFAHQICAEKDLTTRRVFGTISLQDMVEKDLYELRELVLTEINERESTSAGELELF